MEYVLILGANSDIGMAVADKYASSGYNLYLADKNLEKLENTKQFLSEKYQNTDIKTLKFDVLEFYNHRNFYNNLDPKPVGLICTEEYVGNQARSQKDFLEVKKIVDTNYTGIISILNIAANDFEARNQGFIIGIGSTVGDENKRTLYSYYSSKTGFLSYLAGLRHRLSKTNVKVFTIRPGFVDTEMTKFIQNDNKKLTTPEDVAKMILKAQKKGKDITYKKGFGKFKTFIKDALEK